MEFKAGTISNQCDRLEKQGQKKAVIIAQMPMQLHRIFMKYRSLQVQVRQYQRWKTRFPMLWWL